VFGVSAVQAQGGALPVLHHHRHRDGREQGVDGRQAGAQFVGHAAALGYVTAHAFVTEEAALGIETRPAVEFDPARGITPGAGAPPCCDVAASPQAGRRATVRDGA